MLVLSGTRIKRQWAAVTPQSQFPLLNEGRGLGAVWLSERGKVSSDKPPG